jgi:hypothetical protein
MPYVREGKKVILYDHPDYDPEGDTVEFRLTYEGPLHSSGNNNSNATEKHAIRKIFHRELKFLWESTPHLNVSLSPNAIRELTIPYVRKRDRGATTPHPEDLAWAERINEKRSNYLAKNFSRFGFRFVPLVAEDLLLWCGIDILFLRPGSPGKVFESGDIDNRIKTLFDALKTPKQLEQLGDFKNRGPGIEEDPFYCLLEDDGLVSKVSIETDTLLEPIAGGIPAESDARLVITVKLRPATVLISNMGFV